jgi:RNA polymerase sigma factor (sigma-70 family)
MKYEEETHPNYGEEDMALRNVADLIGMKDALPPYEPMSTEDIQALKEDLDPILYRNTLVESNLRLVCHIIFQRYRSYQVDAMDLFQAGSEALMKAAEKYDPSRNIAFSTYATYWLRMSLDREVWNRSNSIHVSSIRHSDTIKIKQLQDRYYKKHGEYPTVDYLSERIGKDVEYVTELLVGNDISSITQPDIDGVVDDIDIPYHDPNIEKRIEVAEILEMIPDLPDRKMIEYRYLHGMTYVEIADTLEREGIITISYQSVANHLTKTIDYLKSILLAEDIDDIFREYGSAE